MIAHIRGKIVTVGEGDVVLDVGGVGYRALISATTRRRLPAAGEEALLVTHLHVREDALVLYGFADAEERALFDHLLAVDGVGPKLALAVLSAVPPAQFRQAILFEDLAALTRIPGVGKKTAQRMLLELRDRLGALPEPATAPLSTAPAAADPDPATEALEALVGLGYSRPEAAPAIERARQDGATRVADLVRLALRSLSSRT